MDPDKKITKIKKKFELVAAIFCWLIEWLLACDVSYTNRFIAWIVGFKASFLNVISPDNKWVSYMIRNL